MTELRKIQLLEKSHFNQLSKSERQELDRLAAQDAQFAKEAAQTEELFQGLGALALDDFEQQMSGWESKYQSHKKSKVRKMAVVGGSGGGTFRRLLRIAAVVLVLFLPVAYFAASGGFTSPASNEDLFQAYYAEGPQFMDFRVRGDDSAKPGIQQELENRKRQGLILFNKGDYKMATHNLSLYVEHSPKRDYEAIVALATAQVVQGNADKAIPLYQLVLETEEPTALAYQDQASWYLALAQLRNNELTAAKMQLQELAKDENNDYQEQGQKLLKELQERK